MSDITTLREYLVGLGFSVDLNQYRQQFQKPLEDAAKLVSKETQSMTIDVLKWQTVLVGMFTAITGAVVGAMDKVAMADQDFRLFGERMFMDAQHAKSLKIAMDALGHSLNEIAFDPELHARFIQLQKDQRLLQGGLGPDFEENMKRIRDVRFELTRLQVSLQYLLMGSVNEIFKALGFGSNDLLVNLQKINAWLQHNLPAIAKDIAIYVVPVLKETWTILTDIWHVVELAGNVFANFIGLISGDSSLVGVANNFDNVARSVEKVIGWLAKLVGYITQAESLLLHFANAGILTFSGHFAEARAELSAGLSQLNIGSGAISGGIVGTGIGILTGAAEGATAGTIVLPGIGTILGGIGGAFEGGLAGAGIGGGLGALVRAVAHQESGGKQYDKHGNVLTSSAGALGIMQLLPSTAAGLGVNPNDAADNVRGGTIYLQQLLKHYNGNLINALMAYNWGPGNLDHALKTGGSIPESVRNYASSVARNYERQTSNGGSNITIGDIHVMQTDPHPDMIKRAVVDAINQHQGKQIQRNLVELQGATG